MKLRSYVGIHHVGSGQSQVPNQRHGTVQATPRRNAKANMPVVPNQVGEFRERFFVTGEGVI